MAPMTGAPAGRIGEIVSASTTTFVAQVARSADAELGLARPPAFGAFVRAVAEEDGLEAFGVVYLAETGGVDGAHRPLALDLTRQQLRERQPQVFDLLRTDFGAVTIAHRRDGALRHHLPPYPPQVHDFVYPCTPADVLLVTGKLDFLRTLLAFGEGPADELVAAVVRQAVAARPGDRGFRLEAGRALTRLLKHDYGRLQAILGLLE
jgi:hypothetical protein